MKHSFEIIVRNVVASRDELHEKFFESRIYDAMLTIIGRDAHFDFDIEAESLPVAMFKAVFELSRVLEDEKE